ncbi:MAG: hypothetical protein JSU09_14580 [Bacteroidetes bacterium]|nr:hypothetical protein [Bacteroidota bacterium]
MKIIVSFIPLLGFIACSAQNFKAFINKADSLYAAKNFSKSSEYYVDALELIDEKYVEPIELFNTAKSFAMLGEASKSVFYLRKAIGRGGLTSARLQETSDFKLIQPTNQWKSLIKEAKRIDKDIDSALIAKLQTIGINDQLYRKKIDSLYLNKIKNNEIKRSYFKQQDFLDSINLFQVKGILDSQGFPSRRIVGRHNTVLFYVIQHANLEIQEKYYPKFEEAANAGNLSWRVLCLMTDRIRMRKGLKQIYGTQITSGKDGESILYDVEDYDNLDKRRQEIGLEPIKDYAKFFGVKL